MTTPAPHSHPHSHPRQALARSIGLSAFVYGYPLIESMRTCRMQTSGATLRAPIDTLFHIRQASTDKDRDIVTPANDLLYTTAWINLSDGPRVLTVPAAVRHPGRYFVLALYDAYTENFANIGPRNSLAEGEDVVLIGPDAEVPEAYRKHRIVRSPTHLVWLIGRILVADADDLPGARALQAEIALHTAPGTGRGTRPLAVEQWPGEPIDAMAEAFEQGKPAADVAPRFFTSLCQALVDAPGRTEDRGMVAWFNQAGLMANAHFQWAALEAPVQAGLIEGFGDAINLVAVAARSRRATPWVLASRAGRYGNDYLVRALTAYIGLGALATDEALYGAGHFDAEGKPLDGQHHYTLRFARDDMPPAEAFWSVTLYGADRYLYPNAIGRHSIGDRTQGLHYDSDGSLTLLFAHQAPTDAAQRANWMPTPAGHFYLILRLYYPPVDARKWKVPPLTKVGSKVTA